MGAVYEAEQDSPRRRVALKTVRRGVVTPSLLRRFRYETEVLGRLQHPGIGQIFEAGTFDAGEGTQPFFAMEFLDGPSLVEYSRSEQLEIDERLKLFADVCDAVHHAHQKGVIHRDLKPDNILVVDGTPKILDFGVARAADSDIHSTTVHTGDGQIVGTLPYMSPEQVSGKVDALDTQCDIYSLGVVLFELLANRLPFELDGVSFPDAIRTICEDEPPRLGSIDGTLRGDVETIVRKALSKEKHLRYPSAAALASDIQRHLAHEPIAARPPSTLYQLRKFARRNTALVAGVAIAFLALVVALVLTVRIGIREAEQREIASRAAEMAVHRANRANLRAALVGIEVNRFETAERYLAEIAPEHRDWEWYHIHSLTDARTVSLELAGVSDPLPPQRLVAIAFDPDSRHLYWTDRVESCVSRIHIEAGTVERVVHVAPRLPIGVAVDEERHEVYWSATDGESLEAFTLRDGRVERVAELTSSTFQLAIDARTRRLFWADAGSRGAMWARIDGGNEQGILELTMPMTGSFALDGRHRRVVWASPTELHHAGLDGSGAVVLDRVHANSVALDVESGFCYWSGASAASALTRSTLDGSRRERLVMARINPGQLVTDASTGRLFFGDAQGDRILAYDTVSRTVETLLSSSTDVTFRDGEPHVITAADGPIRMIAAETGEEVLRIGESTDRFRFVTLSSDGLYIGAIDASDPPRLRTWDATTGRELHGLPVDPTNLLEIRVLPSHPRVLLERASGLSVLDLETGSVVWQSRFEELDASIETCVSANGSRVLLKSHATNQTSISNIETGETIMSVGVPANPMFPVAALSDDGELFAVSGEHGTVYVYRAEPFERLAVVRPTNGPTQLAFSPDGRFLASTTLLQHSSTVVEIFDLHTEEASVRSSVALTHRPAMAWREDGTRLLLADGRHAQVIDLDRRSYIEMRGHESYVYYVAYSPDGSLLASMAWDTTVRLWDAGTGELLKTFPTQRGPSAPIAAGLGFNDDGSRLHAGDLVWDVATGRRIDTEPARASDSERTHPPPPLNGDWWAGFWRHARGGTKGQYESDWGGENLASSIDGRFLAMGLPTGEIRITHLESGSTRLIPCNAGRPRGRVRALAFSPDGKRLLAGSDDGMVRVLDVDRSEVIATLAGHSGMVYTVNYNPTGTRFASAGRDRTVILRDAESLEPIIELVAATDYVHSVAFSPDGTRIAAGSGDGVIYQWDTVPRSRRLREARESR